MNDRAIIPSAIPADIAERISDTAIDFTQSDQRAIASRADELMAARLDDGARFSELMSGIDASSYEPYLHRALLHVESALNGDKIAIMYSLNYLRKILLLVRAEAEICWRDELTEKAEWELPC